MSLSTDSTAWLCGSVDGEATKPRLEGTNRLDAPEPSVYRMKGSYPTCNSSAIERSQPGPKSGFSAIWEAHSRVSVTGLST